MGHYRSNLRDIRFNLFEVLGVDDYLGEAPFDTMDSDTARMILSEVDRFCRESVWADSFVPTDRTPLELDVATGDVTIPDELHEALTAFYDAGWHTLPLPTSLGGFGSAPSIRWAAAEMFLGSHATAALWPIGALMAMIIDEVGTPGQVERFARPMVEDRWGGTMVLTEPDAGSDVGAGTTSAVRASDNGPEDLGSVWHLSGVKRFITSADAQTHPNTVHLVLARPEGGEPGTKGLRLFLVPKRHVLADGSLGERNGVKVTNLEKKMGIKGSATCELSLGQDPDNPCVGYLMGDLDTRGAGIAQMFRVIEYARMTVGTKAMGTLSTGYLNALDYAKLRKQGPDMIHMADPTAPKVEIISHPDVRRLLMEQKAHAEGMRALVLLAGWTQDQKALAVAAGDAEAASTWERREDLLLPLVKGYCSEKAYELLGSASLQTFGGSGFTQDYPIEQYIRDAKIDTLYEGTTAIQSLDLFFRKIAKDMGQTLLWFVEQAHALIEHGPDHLADERKALMRTLEDVQGHLAVHSQHALAAMGDDHRHTELYKIGLHSVALLDSIAEAVIGWMLLRQADVARAALDAGTANGDVAFYEGKLAVASYWARSVLPKSRLRRDLAAAEDGELMELPTEVF